MALPKWLPALPDGNLGLAIKVALVLAGSIWWTSGPGEEEESEFKAKSEKRRGYQRHYAFKGRGRKESLYESVRDDRAELVPTREACGAA